MRYRYLGLISAAVVTSLTLTPSPAGATSGSQVRASGPTYVYAPPAPEDLNDIKTRVKAVSTSSGETIVTFGVTGIPESYRGRTFGVHVHVNPCGASPADIGPHYANPKAAASDPLKKREIWLDFTVTKAGTGHSKTVHPYLIAPGAANAVVIHEQPTDKDTGDAGDRWVCTSVPFGNTG